MYCIICSVWQSGAILYLCGVLLKRLLCINIVLCIVLLYLCLNMYCMISGSVEQFGWQLGGHQSRYQTRPLVCQPTLNFNSTIIDSKSNQAIWSKVYQTGPKMVNIVQNYHNLSKIFQNFTFVTFSIKFPNDCQTKLQPTWIVVDADPNFLPSVTNLNHILFPDPSKVKRRQQKKVLVVFLK